MRNTEYGSQPKLKEQQKNKQNQCHNHGVWVLFGVAHFFFLIISKHMCSNAVLRHEITFAVQ